MAELWKLRVIVEDVKNIVLRRQVVVKGSPAAGEFKASWPALFHINEVNTEFQCITALQLETTFMAHLDSLTPQLTSVFQRKGGVYGQKLAQHLQIMHQDIEGDDIQEYTMQKYTMGIYVINKEAGQNRNYDDIGTFAEQEIIIDSIGSLGQTCAVMLCVIYALNLAYPKELRYYYEFIQKVLMRLDGEKLSPKVLGLKNKIAFGQKDF